MRPFKSKRVKQYSADLCKSGDPQILRALVQLPEPSIQVAVSRWNQMLCNKHVPSDVLRWLAERTTAIFEADGFQPVSETDITNLVYGLCHHQQMPNDILLEFSRYCEKTQPHTTARFHRALARNKCLESALLEEVSAHNCRTSHPSSWEQIWEQTDIDRILLEHRNSTEKVVHNIGTRWADWLQSATQATRRFVDRRVDTLVPIILTHDKAGSDVLIRLHPHVSALMRSSIAFDSTNIRLLEVWSGDENVIVRRHIAANPNTPITVLTLLMLDTDPEVASEAALSARRDRQRYRPS